REANAIPPLPAVHDGTQGQDRAAALSRCTESARRRIHVREQRSPRRTRRVQCDEVSARGWKRDEAGFREAVERAARLDGPNLTGDRMRLVTFRRTALLTLTAATVLGTSGCFGSFNLTRKLYGFNKDVSKDKFVRELVFLGLNIVPIYGV